MEQLDSIRNAYFIKLGAGGEWERDCLETGVIRLDYRRNPQELAEAGLWDEVKAQMHGVWSSDKGAMTRHVNQVRIFFEAGPEDVFVTFSGGAMHWCRPTGAVERDAAGLHTRGTVGGWSDRDLKGEPLWENRLSGALTMVQMFQGTVCEIKEQSYLINKIQGEDRPEVIRARQAERELTVSVEALLPLLTWRDFELLVDLLFSTSGWRRIGEVGGPQKTLDIDLRLPSTNERAFVQVKSRCEPSDLRDYVERFRGSKIYDRMFFVWHSGSSGTAVEDPRLTLIGPDRLARMVVDGGLSRWLCDRVG
ncbi:MAG: restriction endonuclease [Pseudomonadota bacterium]